MKQKGKHRNEAASAPVHGTDYLWRGIHSTLQIIAIQPQPRLLVHSNYVNRICIIKYREFVSHTHAQNRRLAGTWVLRTWIHIPLETSFVHGAPNGLVLVMHIGFLACFHAISLERSRFSKIASLIFVPLWH